MSRDILWQSCLCHAILALRILSSLCQKRRLIAHSLVSRAHLPTNPLYKPRRPDVECGCCAVVNHYHPLDQDYFGTRQTFCSADFRKIAPREPRQTQVARNYLRNHNILYHLHVNSPCHSSDSARLTTFPSVDPIHPLLQPEFVKIHPSRIARCSIISRYLGPWMFYAVI